MSASLPTGVYATLEQLVALKHQATGFSFLPRQPVQSLLAGQHASRLRGRGLNFDEMRQYLPGDDVRQIDWKATARLRTPQTRVYTEERERPVFLVVDQRLGMFFGTKRALKSVVAAEAAALAAWRTIAVKDRVGAVVFNDEGCQVVRPQRTRQTVLRILRTILDMNHALRADSKIVPNPAMFNAALVQIQRLAMHDCLAVLITDADGADASSEKLVTEIARHNDVLIIFVFDPLEADLPQEGRYILSDGNRQLEMDAGHASLRERFRSEFAQRRAVGKHFLITREVPVLPLTTSEEVLPQVMRALGAGPRRRRSS